MKLAALLVGAIVASVSPSAAPTPREGARAKAFATRIAALGPRPAGSAAERKAAGLVAARFRSLGYRVERQPFPLPGGGQSLNVVGRSVGPVDLVIGAHLDSVSAGPGANDNASGVGAMLELASSYTERCCISFVAFGGQERVVTSVHVHLGALRFVRSIPRIARGHLRMAVVIDKVGVGDRFYVRGIERTPNRSAQPFVYDGVAYRRDAGVSDHAELTRAGMPAAWVEWRTDPCWHSACDTADRLDPRKLQHAIDAVDAAVSAEADDPPAP